MIIIIIIIIIIIFFFFIVIIIFFFFSFHAVDASSWLFRTTLTYPVDLTTF